MRPFFLALMTILSFSTTLARADEVQAEKSSSGSTSQDVRDGQHFNAALRAGLMYTLVPGAGVEGNMILNKHFQVGASVNSGSLKNVKAESNDGNNQINSTDDDNDDDDDTDANLDKADLRASSVEGHVRWFPFNSLYVIGGMSYRTVRSEIQFSDAANSGNSVNTKTNSRAVCVDAGIGNEWSWESGFFIGAEWLGLSTAVLTSSDTDTDTDGVPSDDVKDQAASGRKFAEQIGKGTSARLAMLHMGWAF